MRPSEILRYYLRDDVIDKLLNVKDRECAVRYGDKFGKRPMILQYKSDIERFVKGGATSFHVSEERWYNPLALGTEMKREDFDDLRKGWDLLIDVDCKDFEIARTFTGLLINKIEKEGIRSFSVKFSGGTGFHLLVPYEAFPEEVNGKMINRLFPDASMIISIFLKNALKPELSAVLLKDYGIPKLTKLFNIDEKMMHSGGRFDPYALVDIDTVLISERHLFRSQYSINEKKGFVSLPIEKNRLTTFSLDSAKPESVETKLDFFDLKPERNEAARLFISAYDSSSAPEEEKSKKTEMKEYKPMNLSLDKTKLPPCLRLIDSGLADGRKRSVFILVNFYRSIGKSKDDVLVLLKDWNTRNKPPLKEQQLKQQVDYAFAGKSYPPPNCEAAGYYKYFGVCFPNETCKLIKNPLSYYTRLMRSSGQQAKVKRRSTKYTEKDMVD